ncbi:MAG: LuxR C-terminal-related transcriptional regulator [Angustibacter sp.]
MTHSVQAAQQALAAGAWDAAASAFAALADRTADPAGFEGLAQVAWWRDDATACLSARESAYRRYRDLGDVRGAARAAASLAYDSLLFGRGQAVAAGWLARAHELVAELPEVPEHGWCAVREAELTFATGRDVGRALACARHAAEVGRRTGDDDLRIVGTALEGLALTETGEVEAGLSRLDLAAAAATAGDVRDVMWMGKVLCWLIAACHQVQDVTRAQDWCRRTQAICLERDLVPLFTVCRIQYASVQVSGGPWGEAERELTQTVEGLASSQRASRLEAVVQLGELRRRQGRLTEAQALFRQAEFHPVAELGCALIAFASGDVEPAWTAVRRMLEAVPRVERLRRADLLLPAVRCAHAVGDGESAAAAVEELRAIATEVGTAALLARSASADAVLAGPPSDAVLLREAVRQYQRAGLRHDEADARIGLATALLAQGDARGAREQARAAGDVLAGLDDPVTHARARELARSAAARPAPVLTAREIEVLRLVAQGLSNDDIAGVLTLSGHTVHRHVANILTKLGQPTRAAAVSHAITRGLLQGSAR